MYKINIIYVRKNVKNVIIFCLSKDLLTSSKQFIPFHCSTTILQVNCRIHNNEPSKHMLRISPVTSYAVVNLKQMALYLRQIEFAYIDLKPTKQNYSKHNDSSSIFPFSDNIVILVESK